MSASEEASLQGGSRLSPVSVPTSSRGYGAAVVVGIAIALLGVIVGAASIHMAYSTANGWWLLLLLPALGLVKLGTMVCRARPEGAKRFRPIRPVGVKRTHVQDFAHHNRAWDNVSRWEKRYGGGADGEVRAAKPQMKLRSWSLKLKR
jgi:hypothetical protein